MEVCEEGVITNKIKVPTGHIGIIQGDKDKPLEFLSIGDYGKAKNIKADFLGHTKEINGVPHGDLLPLEDKWVITISTQYGCSMGCTFCDVPKVGTGLNVTFWDLINQVKGALSFHPEVKDANRINLHYARMGEPLWNRDVINSAYYLSGFFKEKGWGFHPVVSTMYPEINNSFYYIRDWLHFKNKVMNGNAGLQISINTTDQEYRKKTMPMASTLENISAELADVIRRVNGVQGRKIALNFALTEAPIDAEYLRELFDPEYFMCKITPMHMTQSCRDNNLVTKDGYDYYYPYKKVEEDLKKEGFDVLVFVPSKEEDESGITCGNAILSNGGNKNE